MTKPEMIIFDYGHTILHEPNHSVENGNKAIFKYIKDNPDNVGFETFNKTCIEMFAKIKAARGTLEIHEHHLAQLLYVGYDVSGDKWDPRNWDNQKSVRSNMIFTAIKLIEEL